MWDEHVEIGDVDLWRRRGRYSGLAHLERGPAEHAGALHAQVRPFLVVVAVEVGDPVDVLADRVELRTVAAPDDRTELLVRGGPDDRSAGPRRRR